MKKPSRFSLRLRLMALVLLALLPAFALIIYQAVEDGRRAADTVKATVRLLVHQAAENHERLINDGHDLLGFIGRLPKSLFDSAACQNLLAEIADRHANFDRIIVVAATGAVTCGSHTDYAGVNFSDRRWFKEAVQSGKFAASEIMIGRVTRKPSVYFTAPLLDNSGVASGAVGLSVQLDWISRMTDQVRLPPGSTFTIFDDRGTVLARQPDPDKWLGKPFPQAPLVREHVRDQDVRTMETRDVDGIERLYTFKNLGAGKGIQSWYLAVGIPKDATYGPVRALLARNLLLMAIVAALVLATAWLGSGRLVGRPIRSLVKAAAKWGAGDLNARTGMAQRRDEFGQLARAFDQMAGTLQGRDMDRIRAEQTRAQLAAIVESSSDAIMGKTHDGIVTSWNKGAEKLFGYTAEEVIGHSIMLLVPGHEIEKVAENFARIKRGEQIESYETIRLKKGGVPIDVSVTVSPIVDIAGQVIGACSITRDIGGRKRAENELKALHDINLAITSSLDLPTVLKILLEKIEVRLPYAASHIRLIDKATSKLEPMACRNIDEDQWKAGGTGFRHAIHRTILPSKRPLVIPDMQSDETVPRREFYRQQGLVSYLGVPLIVKDEAIGVLSLLTKEMHEFTLREIRFAESLAKQASIAIYHSQLYERSKKLSEELAGSEAHIRGLVKGLIHARDEQAKRIAHALHDESGQLLAMVYIALDELAGDFSPAGRARVQHIKSLLDDVEMRLRELSHELHPPMLDHLGLIPSIEHLANQISKRTGIDINVAAAVNERLSPVLELSIFRVVQEAFNNAVKHARANRIEVRIMQDEELIQCAIQDDGVGISPAIGRQRQNHRGSGLGLAGMRERIEGIGGDFQIVSAPGEGTKLFITMPREKPHDGAQSITR
jgi:PAS domain S-box-containing protein